MKTVFSRAAARRQAARRQPQGVFLHFILSYITILLIPILIISVFATHDLRVRQNEALEASQAVLNQSAENIENRFMELTRVASLLSSDDTLARMLGSATPAYYDEYLLYRKLLNFCYANNFLNRCYVAFQKGDESYVVGSDGTISSIPFFFQISYNRFKTESDVWWQAQRRQLGQVCIDRMRVGGAWTDVLLMRNPLVQGDGVKTPDSMILMDISLGEIQNLISNPGQLLSYSFTNQGGETTTLMRSPEEDAQKALHLRYVSSSGRVHECTLSENTVLAGWRHKLLAYALIFSLVSLLGGAFCFWLARRRSMPVNEMMRLLSADQADRPRVTNVLNYLQSSVRDLVQDRQALHAELERRQPLLQVAFMERLLFGTLSDFSDIPSQLRELGITLEGASYQVAIIQPLSVPHDEESETMACLTLENALFQATGGNCYVYSMNDRRVGVILAFSQGGDTTAAARALLLRVLTDAEAEHQLRARAALGKPYESLADVFLSYAQAQKTFDALGAEDGEQIVDYLREHSDTHYFYYPSELELKLVRVASSGNEEAAREVFQELYEENFRREKLSPAMLRYFLAELNGTYLKIAANVQKRDVHLPLPDESEPTEEAFWRIEARYQQCCRLLRKSKDDGERQMQKRLTEYLSARYADPSLSLTMLADSFGVSEVYMSRLFKKHMGETFSQVLEKTRMTAARDMLRDTRLSVAQISEKCGYTSAHAFRRAFKRFFGDLPSEKREENEP
ncbi:MAG: helix-turn-helix domain-containing protein [Eubacteriales bacterium]|nr:helix-turn-helix domain-containing protein [Eubacteriales bacterium]